MPADINADDTAAGGYGKPPRRTQFKKGQSGNPKGRPKGTPNFATAFEEALNEPVVVNEGGQRKTVGKGVAIVKVVVNKAMQGDARATQQVFKAVPVLESNRSHASPPTLTLTDADEQVMQHLATRIRAMTPTPGGTDNALHP
jgi:hypothetical protein